MFRGYDSGVVLREDIIVRVKLLRDEIADSQRLVERLKREAAAGERRILKLKRELGIADLSRLLSP